MRTSVRLLFVFAFFIAFLSSHAQNQKNTNHFKLKVKKSSEKFTDIINFTKARSFFLANEWDSTLVYTMRQLNVASNNKELNNYCHLFRAQSFLEKKLFKEAQKEFSKISRDFEFYNNVRVLLGSVALELEDYETAINYYKEIEQLDDNQLLGIRRENLIHNMGLCYLHLKEYITSERYLMKSLQTQEAQLDTLEMIGSNGDLGNLYYVQYKDDLAIPYFEKAYALSKYVDDPMAKQNAAKNMAIVAENKKKYKEALIYRKEFEQWKDSVNDQIKIWEVAEREKLDAARENQKKVGLLQAQNKIKIAERNGFFYSALVLLVLLIVVFFFYKEKVKNNKIITEQKETLNELNATKDKLFSIVSHDLRSSVEALKKSNTKLFESLETKNISALDKLLQSNSAIVNGAYSLLDNLLHWALLQTKQSYFEIQQMRLFFIAEQVAYNYKPLMLEKKLHFENTVSKKDIVFADQETLKLILRNLLDNAIKFSKPNGSIKIYSQNNSQEYCNLVIEDTGLGMSEAKRLELLKGTKLLSKKENENIIGTGLGLQLCKSMIKKNKGLFAIESELQKGTKMIVSLRKTLPNG